MNNSACVSGTLFVRCIWCLPFLVLLRTLKGTPLTCSTGQVDKVFLFIGHRAVYVGVHVPLGRQSRRRHRHRGHKHHRKRKDRESEREDGRESPTYGKNNSLECLS